MIICLKIKLHLVKHSQHFMFHKGNVLHVHWRKLRCLYLFYGCFICSWDQIQCFFEYLEYVPGPFEKYYTQSCTIFGKKAKSKAHLALNGWKCLSNFWAFAVVSPFCYIIMKKVLGNVRPFSLWYYPVGLELPVKDHLKEKWIVLSADSEQWWSINSHSENRL